MENDLIIGGNYLDPNTNKMEMTIFFYSFGNLLTLNEKVYKDDNLISL
jgi:hypothetical protein